MVLAGESPERGVDAQRADRVQAVRQRDGVVLTAVEDSYRYVESVSGIGEIVPVEVVDKSLVDREAGCVLHLTTRPNGIGKLVERPAVRDRCSGGDGTDAPVRGGVIAGAVAGPLGLFGALFIAEVASDGLREVIKPGVEILAGIPSIVYGFIGFTVLSPWASDQFELTGQGTYLFVGVVVGLMALPTVVSVAEDALSSVPESMKSGSLAVGTTDWQTMTSITLPAAFSGVSAAVLLGVGRAIGETMAATVMLRGVPRLTEPLVNVFYGQETLTSLIARNYGEADGFQLDALFIAGVILFVTVLFISIGAQYIEWRMRRTLGGDV